MNDQEKIEITKEEKEEYEQLKSMFKNIEEGISSMSKKQDSKDEE